MLSKNEDMLNGTLMMIAFDHVINNRPSHDMTRKEKDDLILDGLKEALDDWHNTLEDPDTI